MQSIPTGTCTYFKLDGFGHNCISVPRRRTTEPLLAGPSPARKPDLAYAVDRQATVEEPR